jgi:hypothetical protein
MKTDPRLSFAPEMIEKRWEAKANLVRHVRQAGIAVPNLRVRRGPALSARFIANDLSGPLVRAAADRLKFILQLGQGQNHSEPIFGAHVCDLRGTEGESGLEGEF